MQGEAHAAYAQRGRVRGQRALSQLREDKALPHLAERHVRLGYDLAALEPLAVVGQLQLLPVRRRANLALRLVEEAVLVHGQLPAAGALHSLLVRRQRVYSAAARAGVVIPYNVPHAVAELERAHVLLLLGVGVHIQVLAYVREDFLCGHVRELLRRILVHDAVLEQLAAVEVVLPPRLDEISALAAEGHHLAAELLRQLGRGRGDVRALAVVAYPALAEQQHAVPAADAAHYVNHSARLAGAFGDRDGVEPVAEAPAEQTHRRHVLAGDEVHVVLYVLGHHQEVQIRGVVGEDKHRLGVLHRVLHPHAVGAVAHDLEYGSEQRVDAPVERVRMSLRLLLRRAHSVHSSSGLLA